MSKRIDWQKTEPIWEAAPNVIAAWAFGSARDGQLNEGSDVDIGILFDSKLSFDEQLDLLAGLQTALQVEAIDLVPLNEANPILRFEAISGPAPSFAETPAGRAEFASLTAREYEDEMAFLEGALAARR